MVAILVYFGVFLGKIIRESYIVNLMARFAAVSVAYLQIGFGCCFFWKLYIVIVCASVE